MVRCGPPPIEKFTVNPGFRDWTATTISGSTIVGGNSSNRGGLFAVDTLSGKLKWSARPAGTARGNPFVATRPVVSGDIVIAPMGETLMALNLATGKEVWRGRDPVVVLTSDGRGQLALRLRDAGRPRLVGRFVPGAREVAIAAPFNPRKNESPAL